MIVVWLSGAGNTIPMVGLVMCKVSGMCRRSLVRCVFVCACADDLRATHVPAVPVQPGHEHLLLQQRVGVHRGVVGHDSFVCFFLMVSVSKGWRGPGGGARWWQMVWLKEEEEEEEGGGVAEEGSGEGGTLSELMLWLPLYEPDP